MKTQSNNSTRNQFLPTPLLVFVYFIFFSSGAASLVYEVSWMRMFSLILGSTTLAGSLVLAAFFSGLALGAWLLGRMVDKYGRPLLIYCLMEIGLGIYALLSKDLFNIIDKASIQITGYSHANIFQFVFLWIALLIPTALMGGTLPVISKYLVQRLERSGRIIGRLYAVNTWGAVLGTVLSAFVLIKIFGLAHAIATAALVNIGIGLCILAMRVFKLLTPFYVHRSNQTETFHDRVIDNIDQERAFPMTNQALNRLLLIIAFVSGFTALATEVFWLRLFSISFDSSIQSFAIVLSIFLCGFAFGSYVFARVADTSRNPLVWMGGFFSVAALFLCVSIPFLDRLPLLYFHLLQKYADVWSESVIVRYALASVVLLPLTFIMGGVFPVGVRLFIQRMNRVGGSVGVFYTWNTVGGILGSLLAGLILIPWLGTRVAFIVMSCIMAMMSCWIFHSGKKMTVRNVHGLVLIAAFLFAVIIGPWKPERMIVWWGGQKLEKSNVLFYEEGREANVAVVRRNDYNALFVGKKLVAADDPETQRHLGLLSHIPLLLHPNPEKILVIGLATGITVNAALAYPVTSVECVDINPLMEQAAGYFNESNDNVLEKPNVHFVVADARHYIASKQEYVDCIITDPIHPANANSCNLYSLEFYRSAAKALEQDGIMCQWLPSADLNPREVKRIIATFSKAFNYVSLWIPNLSDLALIGSNEPLEVNTRSIEKKLKNVTTAISLALYMEKPTVAGFLSLFAMGGDALQSFCQNIEPNSDNNPILEYEAPTNMWDPENLPDFYFSMNEYWTSSFGELADIVHLDQCDSTKYKLIEEAFFGQRNNICVLAAESTQYLCLLLEKEENYEKALHYYTSMFDLFPETLNPLLLDALIGISLSYEKLGQSQKAREFYLEAINMASSEVESRLLTGQAFALRTQYIRAQAEWHKVLKIDPGNEHAKYLLRSIGAI